MSQHVTLLKKVLLSPGDLAGLDALRSRAADVLQELEEQDDDLGDLLDGAGLTGIDPEWLARVYEALASGEAAPDAPELHAHAEEDADIGSAYAQVLSPSLPPKLQLERWLDNVPELPASHVERLRAAPDTRAAKGFPDALTRKGVTPLVVFNTFEALSTLVQRAARQGLVTASAPLELDLAEGYLQASPYPLRAETVIAEIATMCNRDRDLARSLCHWSIGVAWVVPTLFERVRVEKSAVGIELHPDARSIPDLYVRWKAPARRAGIEGLERLVLAHERSLAGEAALAEA
jgi:hypothetical protein